MPTRFRSRADDGIYQISIQLGKNTYGIESVFRLGDPLPQCMVNRIHAERLVSLDMLEFEVDPNQPWRLGNYDHMTGEWD